MIPITEAAVHILDQLLQEEFLSLCCRSLLTTVHKRGLGYPGELYFCSQCGVPGTSLRHYFDGAFRGITKLEHYGRVT